MAAPHSLDERGNRPISPRGPEIGVALFLLLLSLLVMGDSLRVGIGWADDGPRSGCFPFYIGLLLLASSGWILVGQWGRGREPGAFATRNQLANVAAVAWPMALYVGLIMLVGIYLASAALIAWFMRRHGRYRWALTVPVAVAVPALFYLVFERWFLVPLPKGALDTWLGG